MIISKNTNPERELYYLGALVIDVMSNFSAKEIDLLDIFQKLNEKEKVSMNLFALTLDWLFVLGLVRSNQSNLEKCF